jgi:hypothetical protein
VCLLKPFSPGERSRSLVDVWGKRRRSRSEPRKPH